MKRKQILLLTLAATLFMGSAMRLHAQKVATTSFQFLKVMPTARATAMGEAYSTLATGADALFWNPAGLALASEQQISTTLTLWLFDTKLGAISYALPLGDLGAIGLQLQYVDYGKIEETSVDRLGFEGSGTNLRYNPGLTGNTFSPVAYIVGLTYAKALTDKFSTGLSVKYISESLWGNRTVSVLSPEGQMVDYKTYAKALLFDYGLRYNTGFRSVQIGISVQNLGAAIQYGTDGYPAPLLFRVGTSADLLGPNALLYPSDEHRLTFAYDLFQPNDYAQQMHFGLEYAFNNTFALRSGYKWNYDSDGLTLGAGINIELGGYDLAFDYSYGTMGEFLGQVHRITLGAKIR
ncbi:MAG: PorV/PorQ family protein [bacterium]